MTSERFAIRLMIGQAVLFAGETAVIHHLGAGASIMQIALLRGAAGAILALVLAQGAGLAALRTRQLRLQLLRGLVSLVYLWVMIYSFARLPFGDATAISFSQVISIALFSALLLHEPVTPRRWLAAALALAGALLIARPSFAGWHAVYLIALAGAALNGLAFVLNRHLQQGDTPATTMFYTNAVVLLGNLPALWLTSAPGLSDWYWLAGVLVLGPLGMYAGIVAVRHANASALGPYTLLRLVVAVAGGAIAFQELPGTRSLMGSTLVLLGCALTTPLVEGVSVRLRSHWLRPRACFSSRAGSFGAAP
jgi:drug/metabolite transporter (DMT)-like permease